MIDIEREARALDERTVGWLAAAGFAHRALLLCASLAAAPDVLGGETAVFNVIGALAIAVNAVMSGWLARGGRPAFTRSGYFFVADIGFAMGLNLAATLTLPHGTFLQTGRDVFWQYLLGTVVVWTSLHGPRTGIGLWLGGTLLEIGMIGLNRSHLDGTSIAQFADRIGWLFAGFLIPQIIMTFATRGTKFATAESAKAGREVERIHALADLHDTSLQTYAQISGRAVDSTRVETARIAEILGMAEDEMVRASATVTEVDRVHPPDLDHGLRVLATEFEARGLKVELRTHRTRSSGTLPASEAEAVLGATRELLNNVLKHAGVDRAAITWLRTGHRLSVEVSDEGGGIDLASALHGFGLRNSLERRIHAVGGTVEITSAPGEGTRVAVVIPLSSDEPARRRTDDAISAGAPGAAPIEGEALSWFIIPALAYRACLTPLQVALAVATLPRTPSVPLLALLGGVFFMDVVLLCTARSRFVSGLFGRVQFLVSDFAVAAGLNIWMAHDLARDTAFVPGRQFLWGYVFATVILWTALRGTRTGIVLVGAGIGVELAVYLVNRAAFGLANVMSSFTEVAKLVAAFVITWMITRLARSGVRLAATAGARAGREMVRSEELRQLYEEAYSGLEAIAEICRSDHGPDVELLQRVRGVALQRISRLRGSLQENEPFEADSLHSELVKLAEWYRQAGLRIELVTAELDNMAGDRQIKALVGSSRAALNRMIKDPGAARAVIWAADPHGYTEIVIRSPQAWSDPAPDEQAAASISRAGHIDECGGRVQVTSGPEWGTRVSIRIPHSNRPSQPADEVAHQQQDSGGGAGDEQDQGAEPHCPAGALAHRAEGPHGFAHSLEEVTHDHSPS